MANEKTEPTLRMRIQFRIAVWFWTRATLFAIRFGTVRQIRDAAKMIIEVGEAVEDSELVDIGKVVDDEAEQIALRQKWSWRLRS